LIPPQQVVLSTNVIETKHQWNVLYSAGTIQMGLREPCRT
jgi:hypothetical protein